ncbi:SirB2 family protein [Candidatus Parabeggiatoa sp. HSG14]|uniref:SirB2 family protein n=1 Tax=Candidatus Parabeggiatoa sp. HSG14 TaxID=3055593 RepID=UPI0025A8FEA8|nr:SirB2 family protein [Thiotrichales bacterium HSG14]
MYLIIKNIHISCVILTFISFSTRGIWMIQESHWLHKWWVKVLPHIIDTLLLVSGITLVIILHQYPGTQNWLTAKLLALLVYIIVGSIALKRGKTKTIRVVAFGGALMAFFYLVMVALNRTANPLAWGYLNLY